MYKKTALGLNGIYKSVYKKSTSAFVSRKENGITWNKGEISLLRYVAASF